MTKDNTRVVVTGANWMGSGIGSIESTMMQLFQEARYEILLTVYSASSGADQLFDWLELALIRGVETKMIVNRLGKLPVAVSDQLHRLVEAYPHFHLYNFKADEAIDLHAKTIVIDRMKAIVGSSNLSRRGFLTNYELALIVEGRTATVVASAIDRLISAGHVTSVSMP